MALYSLSLSCVCLCRYFREQNKRRRGRRKSGFITIALLFGHLLDNNTKPFRGDIHNLSSCGEIFLIADHTEGIITCRCRTEHRSPENGYSWLSVFHFVLTYKNMHGTLRRSERGYTMVIDQFSDILITFSRKISNLVKLIKHKSDLNCILLLFIIIY